MPSPTFIRENRLDFKLSGFFKPASDKDILSAFARALLILPGFKINDVSDLSKYWDVKLFKKHDFYFNDHTKRTDIGFITRGAVKLYREYEGKEQVMNLFNEGFFGTLKPYISQKSPNIYKAICVENTIMVTITEQKLKHLLADHPVFADFFHELNENISLFLENRMTLLQIRSAQQRYEDLLRNHPQLLSRFSLNDIANFLGMQPETLSRIRGTACRRAS